VVGRHLDQGDEKRAKLTAIAKPGFATNGGVVEPMTSPLADRGGPPARVLRIAIYLLLSAVACGTVFGLTGCTTYGSASGGFWDCFWLYSIPIPMAFGMVKIPTQVVGTILFLSIPQRSAGAWALSLAGIFVIGLLGHLGFAWAGHRETWGWFGIITVDFGILALIVDSIRPPPERH
jgi:hypothetical protein